MCDEDDYSEVIAEFVMVYLLDQQALGRDVVYESEIWKLLGQPFPKDRHDQKYVLRDDTQVKANENVISFVDYKKRTIN